MRAEKEFFELLDDVICYLRTGFREGKVDERSAETTEKPVNLRLSSEGSSGEIRNFETLSRWMGEIDKRVKLCTKCRLHHNRKNAVPGEGNPDADILFIGEGPGVQEDLQGRPFVGRAGQLLTKMLKAIGLTREEVYITNIVKCRPPENRNPLPDEVTICFHYLEQQIDLIDPVVIVCLGGPAINTVIQSNSGISRLRGTFHRYKGIPVLPTYHPAAVLRFPEKYKRDVWNDLKMLRDYYKDIKSIEKA